MKTVIKFAMAGIAMKHCSLSSNDPHIQQIILDGGLVLIPDENGWDMLKKCPRVDEKPIGVQELVWKILDYVKQHDDLWVALYKPGAQAKCWLACVLLKVTHGWQRVHLEYLTCGKCGWRGRTANPKLSDLYDGLPDWVMALRASDKYPVLPCPKCGAKLPRHPIWTER